MNKERGRNRENQKLKTEIPKPAKMTESEKPDAKKKKEILIELVEKYMY